MRTLKVGLDCSALVATKPATGLERYLTSLITHLASSRGSYGLHLFLYFTHSPSPAQVQAPLLSKFLPCQTITWRIAPLARGWRRLGIGLAMQLDRLDVFHFPAPLMSGYCPVPAVVTFHDLAAMSLESPHVLKERQYLASALDAGRRAAALIAVSQSTRDELIQHVGRSDVTVIPEGVDLLKFVVRSQVEVGAIRQTFGLERYILCVGTLQTRKNHLRLIQAFERVQDNFPHSLVIAGRDGSGADAIRTYMSDHPNPRVRLVGYVGDEALPALYTGADAFVLPSLWEGFGLPLVEAMACGVPTLTSNTSALVEVAGNATVIVDPTDIDEIARNLVSILNDQDLRRRLVRDGHRRAGELSWERSAELTVGVYRQTIDKKL